MFTNSFIACILVIFLYFVTSLIPGFAESDPMLITVTDKANEINFDGKWSFKTEWKFTSLNTIDDVVIIRSAHQDNFIYIFVDVLNDHSLDLGADRTTICFDTENNKSTISDLNDYCFTAILDRDTGFTMQGNPTFGINENFKKISNHDDFISVGGISDENDRYSDVPHPSFEFKIPTDLISRSDHYGFYVESFDAKSGKSYTWPANIYKKSPTHIPESKFWGDMISIDKSLPEFPVPLLILSILVMTMIIMSKKLNSRRLTINNL